MGKDKLIPLSADLDNIDLFNKTVEDFKNYLGKLIVTENDEEIEDIVVRQLKDKQYKISFAESCTGGLLASTIINVNGASEVIEQSFVTYSNKVKHDLLNVSYETIDKNNSLEKNQVTKAKDNLNKIKSNSLLNI